MNYDVVLNANDSATLETQYAFTQGDYGEIRLSIRVKADGQYITNADRAYIVFNLSNGMIVTGADMPKSVATYTYVFQGNELQSPGKVVGDVKLVYADGQISSNKFTFICRYDPLADKNIPAGPYITALQQIVDDGQQKIDYLQALIDALQESIGETAITRNDLQTTRDPAEAGVKAIDAYLAQYMLLKGDLVNNFLTTVTGQFALDAAAGKTLNDKIGNTSNLPSGINDLVSAILQINSNLALKANASDLTNLIQKTLINGYVGDAGTNSYTLKALTAYLVVCATVASNNTSNIAAYIAVPGGEYNTGAIAKLVDNNNFNVVLNGWTLAITCNTYHTTAIKQL